MPNETAPIQAALDRHDAAIASHALTLDQHATRLDALDDSINGIEGWLDHATAPVAYTPRLDSMVVIPCGGAKVGDPANPTRLREGIHLSQVKATTYFRNQFARAEAVGTTRIVIHMPAGWSGTAADSGDMRGASQHAQAMSPYVKQALMEAAYDFRQANPNASIGSYISGQVPADISTAVNGAGGWSAFRAPQHLNAMLSIVDSLVEIGIGDEIWLDHAAPIEYAPGALAFLDILRHTRGIHGGGEAFWRIGAASNSPVDEARCRQAPTFALHRKIARDYPTYRCPVGVEMIAALSPHVVTGTPPITQQVADDYVERGFVLASFDDAYDPMLAAQGGG